MPFNFEAVSDILACPQCHGQLIYVDDALVCGQKEHRLKFPVVDGIPRLLVDEATELTQEEWESFQQRAEQSST